MRKSEEVQGSLVKSGEIRGADRRKEEGTSKAESSSPRRDEAEKQEWSREGSRADLNSDELYPVAQRNKRKS